MTPEDATPFLQALAAIGEVFDRDLSDAAQTFYFDALKDLPLAAVVRALGAAVKTCTFMPKPAEVRELVLDPVGAGDPEVIAEVAWQTYKQLARSVGAYQSVTITDGALAETVVALFGSWEEACWAEFTPEMWAAKRKEFGRIYRLRRAQASAGPITLDGFCARRNLDRFGVRDPLHELPDGECRALPAAPTALAFTDRNRAITAVIAAKVDARRAEAPHATH